MACWARTGAEVCVGRHIPVPSSLQVMKRVEDLDTREKNGTKAELVVLRVYDKSCESSEQFLQGKKGIKKIPISLSKGGNA